MSDYCRCGSIPGQHLVYECRLKAVDPDWWRVWRGPNYFKKETVMTEAAKETGFGRLGPEVRYARDPVFAALVKTLGAFLNQAQYTPTELREACHLAACLYETEHVKPLLVNPQEPFKWNIEEKK